MTDKKQLTIRDVAQLAGVSRSTVSLVLNDSPRISEETRRHVREVIQQVGYRPNALARGLARRQSGMVAVALPHSRQHALANLYIAEALAGIGDALATRGLRLVIELATPKWIGDGAGLRLLRERQADGILLLGTHTTDTFAEDLVGSSYPVVLVNSLLPGAEAVVAANAEGAAEMVRHIAALGHTRIAHIAGRLNTTSGERRLHGYRTGLADMGLEFRPDYVAQGDFSEESGATAMRALLATTPRPSAVFAAGDLMAIGALAVLREAHLKVPDDVALAGADDIELASYVSPSLTTIRQPIYEIGRLATERLLARMAAPDEPTHVTRVPTELVIRSSCGARTAASPAV